MKKNSKQRLFEVMGRLDKTFKPKLNEDFDVEATEEPAMGGMEEIPEEKSPEEKLAALTAKIDSLYAMVHGDEEGEESAEAEEEELEGEPAQEPAELTEWNFDKKKGEKKDEKPKSKTQFNFDKKDDKKDEDSETSKEDKDELDEAGNAGKKIPVAAIAKVGK